jgi:hypothetical protein
VGERIDDEFQVFIDMYMPSGYRRDGRTGLEVVYRDIERLVNIGRIWKQAAIQSDVDARMAKSALTGIQSRFDRIIEMVEDDGCAV